MTKFENRIQAGNLLAEQLASTGNKYDLILALPRGGVPVAKEIAEVLNLPLDVYVVRKLGAPNNPEYGIGAIAEPDMILIDEVPVKHLEITDEELNAVLSKEESELQRRIDMYRNGEELTNITGNSILLVDDGVATGITAKAAILGIKDKEPSSITFSCPVCSLSAHDSLIELVDEMVCLLITEDLRSVGQFYDEFEQVSDEEVIFALNSA